MFKHYVFEGNGRGNHRYPYGAKEVFMFPNSTHSVQIYKSGTEKTNVHIAKSITGTFGSNQNKVFGISDVWTEEQLQIIKSYQRAGYRLNILQSNGNLHLSGYSTEETIEIMKAIYVALMVSNTQPKVNFENSENNRIFVNI
jgi:hypothetical protein